VVRGKAMSGVVFLAVSGAISIFLHGSFRAEAEAEAAW